MSFRARTAGIGNGKRDINVTSHFRVPKTEPTIVFCTIGALTNGCQCAVI
jgi:hypothetical protein